MILGVIFAVISGLLWGLIFIGPMLIPEYPGILQASGRYIAFGLISISLSWYDRKNLYKLSLNDWIEAVKLALTGHLIYYTCLTSAIQCIGAPIATAMVGTLPLILTISSRFYCNKNQIIEPKIPNHILYTSLFCIGLGLLCINFSELQSEFFLFSVWEYLIGLFLVIISILCWTWYALRNAHWLRMHANHQPMTWANAQGVVILPLSFCIYLFVCIFLHRIHDEFVLPCGPRPMFFVFLMIVIGFCCSWLGTFFWNEASQRLPTTLIGPLIIFETISGLIYTFVLRQIWPSFLILIGILFLFFGVIYTLNIRDSDNTSTLL